MTDDVGLLKYFYYGIAGLHKIYRIQNKYITAAADEENK